MSSEYRSGQVTLAKGPEQEQTRLDVPDKCTPCTYIPKPKNVHPTPEEYKKLLPLQSNLLLILILLLLLLFYLLLLLLLVPGDGAVAGDVEHHWALLVPSVLIRVQDLHLKLVRTPSIVKPSTKSNSWICRCNCIRSSNSKPAYQQGSQSQASTHACQSESRISRAQLATAIQRQHASACLASHTCLLALAAMAHTYVQQAMTRMHHLWYSSRCSCRRTSKQIRGWNLA